MLATMVLSLVALLCTLYGVKQFTDDYTCKLTKFNKTIQNACTKMAWIPSGAVLVFILAMALWRGRQQDY